MTYQNLSTKESYEPLTYNIVNCDISREQKQLARERMAKQSFNTGNALYLWDGKHYTLSNKGGD